MNADWFDFELPPELIAQHPTSRRDDSRLMVIDRTNKTITHRFFRDLPELLAPHDLLVLNDTRVVPARLVGHREGTGGRWEGLYLRDRDEHDWEMLTQTRGKPQPGERVVIVPGEFSLTLLERSEGHWLVRPEPAGSSAELLERYGQIPLPPYIRKGVEEPEDRQRYQTVFARHAGSVAAPTAGLHFTPELLEDLNDRGVRHTHVTLHVGLGTFAPIKTEDPTRHEMHSERGEVGVSAVEAIEACHRAGGRVISVGTTATRALESAAAGKETLTAWSGDTRIFIHPPYQFRVIDCLITNFHLPRTTLLLLVASLCGKDLLHRAYAEAIRERYRFFSYGDAMLIV